MPHNFGTCASESFQDYFSWVVCCLSISRHKYTTVLEAPFWLQAWPCTTFPEIKYSLSSHTSLVLKLPQCKSRFLLCWWNSYKRTSTYFLHLLHTINIPAIRPSFHLLSHTSTRVLILKLPVVTVRNHWLFLFYKCDEQSTLSPPQFSCSQETENWNMAANSHCFAGANTHLVVSDCQKTRGSAAQTSTFCMIAKSLTEE